MEEQSFSIFLVVYCHSKFEDFESKDFESEDLARGFSFVRVPACQESQLFENPEVHVIGRADELFEMDTHDILDVILDVMLNFTQTNSRNYYHDSEEEFYGMLPSGPK